MLAPARHALAKYQQLAADLRRAILAGELAAGAQLPTEDELCRRYDVARGTVRRALAELAAEELIDAEHGVGSFVRAPHSNAAPFRFVEEGQAAGALTYRVLAQEVLPAPPGLAAQLKIVPGAPVMRGTACVLEGDIPAAEVHALQQQLPGLTRGEGLLESTFDHYAPVRSDPPTRPRSDNNPLNRKEYLLHVLRRV
ncbi:hypothetical protein SE17_21235 [Kouleothrix aurantiaca]|uniref:HTH gntR-type domain-containing protein n=1 Tax=Kouleothrix aurantiaca TaxID=186479 RepID=A0A0P9FEK8_9CHLR|nr:hypothetical protein SE17_21235 [Kouleothrix aurantiaca]